MLNWIIWIVGLLVMGYVAWRWIIPFIKKHGMKSFTLPVGRSVPPAEPEESEVPNQPSQPPRKHEN